MGSLPGWWRRDGVFLLTMVVGSPDALERPPEELAGSAPLTQALSDAHLDRGPAGDRLSPARAPCVPNPRAIPDAGLTSRPR